MEKKRQIGRQLISMSYQDPVPYSIFRPGGIHGAFRYLPQPFRPGRSGKEEFSLFSSIFPLNLQSFRLIVIHGKNQNYYHWVGHQKR